MKVHLVSARWANFPWGFGSDVYDALLELGCEILDTDYRVERALLLSLLAQPCDLMLVLKGEGISPELIRAAPCTTVLWYPDDLVATEHGKKHIAYNGKAFDRVYGVSLWDLGEYAKLGVEAKWLPVACNPKLHRKLGLEKRYDVSFVGSLYPERKALLERLSKRFDVHYEQAYGEAMVRVFNESRIVINLPVGGFNSGNLSHRIFEVLACGSLLFTNTPPIPHSLFKDKEHLVYYDDSNLETLLTFYLENPTEREIIAEMGRLEVLAKHTVSHRIRQIFEDTT